MSAHSTNEIFEASNKDLYYNPYIKDPIYNADVNDQIIFYKWSEYFLAVYKSESDIKKIPKEFITILDKYNIFKF